MELGSWRVQVPRLFTLALGLSVVDHCFSLVFISRQCIQTGCKKYLQEQEIFLPYRKI